MTFNQMKPILESHVNEMFKKCDTLFTVTFDKDVMWDIYLDSFPIGTNEIYQERREHDCQHCKQFVRAIGNVVIIKNSNTLISVWDCMFDDDVYGPVFKALSDFVKSHVVTNRFITNLTCAGVDHNMGQKPDGSVRRWNHMYAKIPVAYQNKNRIVSCETLMDKDRSCKDVLKRSLETISLDSVDMVLDLINSDSIYKGVEWKGLLESFQKLQKQYAQIAVGPSQDNFCWLKSGDSGAVSKIRNNPIGVCLTNITEGMDLDVAISKYESMVAPTNYKRPKPVFTQKMLSDAKDTVERLGFTRSLRRRFATIDDITVNNVLFADRTSTKRMSGDDIFEELGGSIPTNVKQFTRATEISIDKFIADVLPSLTKMEILLENRHRANIVSLIAPAHADSKPMFKWGNNFSWAYSGNITDSMKERVKAAGGNTNGVLRFSIQWNENDDNKNDFDAHSIEPKNRISYPIKACRQPSSGMLDVDIVNPRGIAVENIIYTDLDKMPNGIYEFGVDVYSYRGGNSGFRAEIEFDGNIFNYNIVEGTRSGFVTVAKIKKSDGKLEMMDDNGGTVNYSEVCNLKINSLNPVTVCMLSPNFWDGNATGNKHFMFMLQDCVNDECPNGFFNEFLQQELMDHKRVFAALGNKMKVEPTDMQLSGLGFSSTKRDHILMKVEGHTSRMLKVMI